ncbi:hypothetical protein PR202_gb04440 [Eleusine coracana subsp. coracana]|uniref:ADP-ribosylation factor GTPase-activating protein AGD14 n=1 Tax=Eleusine coracana subsp. coracana TaxID=191504 RepID=A0AAV5E2Y0_ELECO|nr:hypothetical protein PR202_gb04440 [Eleusine coracana subsp. coracana]
MGSRREEERNEKIIRGLMKLPPNRKCINCNSVSVKNNESEMRRPNSYHSYSQSPPYDFQYEDRRYGKQVDTLARRPSERALFDGKLGNLLFSPGRLRDQMHEDRFANESSGSRFSDFSASSTGDFRNDVLSPSSQDTGYSSPSVHHSRNVSAENPQSQKYASAASQIDSKGVRHSQRTTSAGSFGSFDGSSISNKSAESGYLPDAPTEKPAHSSVNHQSGGSSVSHSTQSHALPPNMSIQNSTDQKFVSRKPVDSVSQIAPTRPPVPAQPTAFTNLDLFDQATMQQPVTAAGTIDLFAGFDDQSLSVSHKTVDLGSQPDVAKEPTHTVLVQKAVTSVPAEAPTTSQPVHQDLFSLSMMHEPVASSSAPQMDLFAGFDQQLPHISSAQKIPSPAPSPGNQGWAFFDRQQNGSLPPVLPLQAEVPAVFPPTAPQNVVGSQSSPAVMDKWNLNAEAMKIPVSKENSQSWNAFGEITQSIQNNLFEFNVMSQIAPHQSATPGARYVGTRAAQDLARGAPERSTPVDMFSGFNVSPDDIARPPFPAPLQPYSGSMVSQPGKSTNPFDVAFESGVEANDVFMDLTSLQTTLPDPHASKDYLCSLTEPWVSQNPAMPYIPPSPQGGLPYVAGQDSHMLNSTHQGSLNPFE